MNRIETKQKGINRDIHSKALTPSAKSPEYKEYLARKSMNERVSRLEDKMDQILELLKGNKD